MNKFFQQLHNTFDETKLTPDSKLLIRNVIVSHMNAHERQRRTFWSGLFDVAMPKTFTFAVSLVLMLVIAGGTAYASQTALPGQLLYPIKVHIAEPVQVVLAFSAEARAEVMLAQSEQRLEEVDIVAHSGAKDSKVYEQLQERFEAKAEKVQASIRELEEGGEGDKAVDVAARFEASLAAHRRILGSIANKEQDGDSSFAKIEQRVEAQQKNTANARTKVESKIQAGDKLDTGTKNLARLKITVAEKAVSGVEDQLKRIGDRANGDNISEVRSKLEVSKENLEKAKIAFEKGDFKESLRLSNLSSTVALEAKVIVSAIIRFKLPVGYLGPSVKEDDSEEVRGDSTDERWRDGQNDDRDGSRSRYRR